MDLAAGLAFIAMTLVFIAAALLAILRIGFGRLDSRIGIERDGPRHGALVPTWRLPDLDGVTRESPGKDQWQLLIFADHSLASFPELVPAVNHVHADPSDIEVIVLTRREANLSRAVAEDLGLSTPIVVVDQAFYNRFNVRVVPFGILVDLDGIVRWTGVANYEEQLRREFRLAQESLTGSAAAPTIRRVSA